MQATVADLMSREVGRISRTSTIRDALQLLVARGFEELYVTDADMRLVGVVPDYELLKYRLADTRDDGLPIENLMTRRLLVVAPITPLSVALRYLRQSCHRRLAVVEQMQVVGQISRGDVLRQLVTEGPAPRWNPTPPRFLRRDRSSASQSVD